jgi:hypothetical protein
VEVGRVAGREVASAVDWEAVALAVVEMAAVAKGAVLVVAEMVVAGMAEEGMGVGMEEATAEVVRAVAVEVVSRVADWVEWMAVVPAMEVVAAPVAAAS